MMYARREAAEERWARDGAKPSGSGGAFGRRGSAVRGCGTNRPAKATAARCTGRGRLVRGTILMHRGSEEVVGLSRCTTVVVGLSVRRAACSAAAVTYTSLVVGAMREQRSKPSGGQRG